MQVTELLRRVPMHVKELLRRHHADAMAVTPPRDTTLCRPCRIRAVFFRALGRKELETLVLVCAHASPGLDPFTNPFTSLAPATLV